MVQNRKDSHGHALRTGECQRKNGRYSFSYTDRDHNRHAVYAGDLISLRKKEQQIRRDIEDGLDPRRAERITVNQVYDAYMQQKFNLKDIENEHLKNHPNFRYKKVNIVMGAKIFHRSE